MVKKVFQRIVAKKRPLDRHLFYSSAQNWLRIVTRHIQSKKFLAFIIAAIAMLVSAEIRFGVLTPVSTLMGSVIDAAFF